MKAYIKIKKLHSDKKNIDYFAFTMNFYGKAYFLNNVSREILLLLLDLKPTELDNLPVGYESKDIEIVL